MTKIPADDSNSNELSAYTGARLWRLYAHHLMRAAPSGDGLESLAERRDENFKASIPPEAALKLLREGTNIGAEIGAKLVVLECEGDGSAVAKRFGIDLNRTLVVTGAGDRSYIYLRMPRAIAAPLKPCPGVRALGPGKVIPVAGCRDTFGALYRFREGSLQSFDELCEAPEGLVRALTKPDPAATIAALIEGEPAGPELPGRWAAIANVVLTQHFTRHDLRTLAFQHGEFLSWEDGRYRPIPRQVLRRLIYAAIPHDMQGVEPSTHTEREVRAALEALCFVELQAPCWRDQGPDDPPASEIVAVLNGLLHVPTARLLEHTPRFFTHNRLAFRFDPLAPLPLRFLAVLERQFEDDPAAMAALAEWFGYCLTPDLSFHRFAVLYGAKRSGKSTVASVLEALLGAENVASPTVQQFGQPFGLASLLNKLAAIVHDANFAQTIPPSFVEILKVITGAGTIDVNVKHRDYVAGALITARPTFVTNNPPNIHDDTGAIEERMMIFAFTHSIPEEDRDASLLATILAEEMPGVLLWALEGRRRLYERGRFSPTETMRDYAADFSADPVREFVDAECEDDRRASETTEAVYAAFANFCHDNGHEPLDRELLGRKLRDVYPHVQRKQRRIGGKVAWHYCGLRLTNPRRGPSRSSQQDWDAII